MVETIFEFIALHKWVLLTFLLFVLFYLAANYYYKLKNPNANYGEITDKERFNRRWILFGILAVTIVFPILSYLVLSNLYEMQGALNNNNLLNKVRLQDIILIIVLAFSVLGFIYKVISKVFRKNNYKYNDYALNNDTKKTREKLSPSEYISINKEINTQEILEKIFELIGYLVIHKKLLHELREEAEILLLNEDIELEDPTELLGILDMYAYDKNAPFLITLDWKSGVDELEESIEKILEVNYPYIKAKLPKHEDYDEDATVSDVEIFDEYSNSLRKKGLQLGFIDTYSDSYMAFIHKSKDVEEIAEIVFSLGMEYYETEKAS